MMWKLNSNRWQSLFAALALMILTGSLCPAQAGNHLDPSNPWTIKKPWAITKPFGSGHGPSMSLGVAGRTAGIHAREIRHTAPRRSLRKLEPVGMPTSGITHQWISPLPESGHNYLKEYGAR